MLRLLQRVLASSILSALPTITLFSQEQLLKDFNVEQATSIEAGNGFCQCGDYLFFRAITEKGRELWRTDGTSAGTILLADINKGLADGFAKAEMVCDQNSILYFTGNDGILGLELWKSDGTTAGTKIVKDVTPGNNNYYDALSILGLIGNTLYFLADPNGDKNFELWKSNGTASSTVEVGVFGLPASVTLYNTFQSETHLYFTIINSSGKFELWVTDGTTDNTVVILRDHYIGVSQAFGNEVQFAVGSPTYTYSLWSSGGTIASTRMIKDFGRSSVYLILKYGNKSMLSVKNATWISDGTSAGTVLIPSVSMHGGATIGGHFYGVGYNYATSAYCVFKTDGTITENFDVTVQIGNPLSFGGSQALGNKLLTLYKDELLGEEIGLFDVTTKTATLLKDINPGVNNSSPYAWASFNGRVYFVADDGSKGFEVWSTDGTESNTQLLKEINTGTKNSFKNYHNVQVDVAVSDGKLQLVAEQQSATALFTSDGTEDGTTSKFTFPVNQAHLFGKAGDELIYHSDRKFYKTRGSSNDVSLIKDLTSDIGAYGYSHRYYHSVDGKLIFNLQTHAGNVAIGSEFWVTDGTELGTKILKDINPGVADGVSGESAIVDTKLIFDGTDPSYGAELWITDGTEEGTILLKDINPGTEGSKPAGFVTLGNKVIFVAADATHGRELWITDGTIQGTTILADIVPGIAGSEITQLNASSHLVFFFVFSSDNGWTLWRTDGTTEGTMMVKDIIPSREKYDLMTNMKAVGDKLFFAADDGEHGVELWVSDGTQAGTFVIDILPGSAHSIPSLFSDVNGVVYFKADASLWRTNGTVQGTSKVAALEPLTIVQLDNWVYFTAPHPDYGIELFKVEFTKLDQQITFEPIATKTFGDVPFELIASSSSGLPLTMSGEEEILLANQTASIVKPGTVTITVTQAGDALYNPTEAKQTLCILPARPTISVTSTTAGEPVLTSSANEGNRWYFSNTIIDDANDKSFIAQESGLYKVNAVIDNCASVFSDEELIAITGTETVGKSIRFYPNPVTDNLKIETTGDAHHQLTLLNLQGKPLSTLAINGNTLLDYETGSLPPGIYFIKVISGQKVSYEKMVKE